MLQLIFGFIMYMCTYPSLQHSSIHHIYIHIYTFYIYYIYRIILERGEGREKERERNINVWLPLARPQLGTWPTTQACALTGDQTSDFLVCGSTINPLGQTSQGYFWWFPYNLQTSIYFTPQLLNMYIMNKVRVQYLFMVLFKVKFT